MAAGFGNGRTAIQRPFAQFLHQLARPGVCLVEIGVEQSQRDAHVADALDVIFVQSFHHVVQNGQLGGDIDQNARQGRAHRCLRLRRGRMVRFCWCKGP